MMSERRPHLVFPLLLIAVGVALVLERLGTWVIPWHTIWRFWPLILVFIGLEMLLSRSRAGGIILALVLVLALVGGVAYLAPRLEVGAWQPWRTSIRGVVETEHLSHPLDGAERATAHIELGVGELELSALPESSEALYEGEIRHDPRRSAVRTNVTADDGEARLDLRSEQGSWRVPGDEIDRWQVRLSPNVPWRLDISGGVHHSQLDLTGLEMDGLQVDVGVGDVTLRLSERGGYQAMVNGGVGRLTIELPEGVEASVHVDAGLSTLSLGPRLRQHGDSYITQGYQTGDKDAIVVDVDGGIGALTIR